MAEQAKVTEEQPTKRTDWADEDDDAEGEDENVEIGGSTVAQVGQASAPIATTESAGRTFMPPPKPRVHRGERNIHGDFVITKINVKVRELEAQKKSPEEEEKGSSEESEEEEPAKAEPVEEVKKGKQKF